MTFPARHVPLGGLGYRTRTEAEQILSFLTKNGYECLLGGTSHAELLLGDEANHFHVIMYRDQVEHAVRAIQAARASGADLPVSSDEGGWVW